MALPVICDARCWHELGCGWQKTSRKRLFMDVRGYFEGAPRDLMMATAATFSRARVLCILFLLFSSKNRSLFPICGQVSGLWYTVCWEGYLGQIMITVLGQVRFGLVEIKVNCTMLCQIGIDRQDQVRETQVSFSIICFLFRLIRAAKCFQDSQEYCIKKTDMQVN